MAETQHFMNAHQQIIEHVVSGTGVTGGDDAQYETLLGKFKQVMATVLQDVGVYSAITHTQTMRALFKTAMRKSLKASLKWLKACGTGKQEDKVQMGINYGMPTFWWGQPGVVSIGYTWYDKYSPGLEEVKRAILEGGSGDESTRVAELDLLYLSCQGELIQKLMRQHDFEKWDSVPEQHDEARPEF